MPAGIVKTPISGRAKEAAVAKSAERTASGGKKFVQTRLPFKLLTPGGGAGAGTAVGGAASGASSSAGDPVTVILDEDDPDPAPRKRKLSYGDETPLEGTGCSGGQLRRSNSKENLDLSSSIATKKVKTTDSVAEDVIELDDDDCDDVIVEKKAVVVKETKEVKPKPKKPEPKKASPAPIQIKLPLVNKRSKRRKSLKKSEEALDSSPKEAAKMGSESSDDIEVYAEELNPQKKPKVQKPLEKSPQQKQEEEEDSQKEEEAPKKQEGPKKTSKESKKGELKGAEPNKKKDQSTIDLFIAKKVDSTKKEKSEAKKKDQSIVADPKTKEAPKKDSIKSLLEPKKAESKPAEKSKKDVNEASATKSQKEKEDAPAKNQKEEKREKNSEPEKVTSKKAETPEKDKIRKQAKKEEPAVQDKSDKESPEAAEISVILSSSDNNSSSSENEMDVDTDTAATDRTSAQKDALLQRKSLPEASDAQKTLTPKQQRLLEQRKKAREEKEQKLAEERRLKQQEKEQREQQKKQERDEKEQQRKLEKDQKEQQRKMEKEEKERKRQAEVDSKNEEKRKRNEAKEEVQRKKDEERRKKEQEREEAEQKKKRAAESFTKFFVPKQPKAGGGSNNTSYLEHEQSSCDSSKASSQALAFRPFQVKDDMLLAPIVRASLGGEQRSQLDGLFRFLEEEEEDEEEEIVRRKPPSRAHLYLSELSSGRREPLKGQRDARLQRRTKDEEEDDEVQVIDDLSNAGLPIEVEQPKQLARMRAKYLHFADNRRPPYYGTWRKKSSSISARRPLAQDKVHFDYELDSDCEWEEEEPGESLSASEDEKERESEEESEEEYNEWYVPHGHLSDEELQNDGEMDDGHTREAQKAKLQVLQQEFAQEMKKQTKKIKPRLLGPVWLDENGNPSQLFPAIFAHTIDMYACWQMEPLSLEPPAEPEREDQVPEPPVPLQLDDRLMQQLVRLTHGNRNSKLFLINEYLEYLKTQATAESTQTVLPSKAVLREKFDELASWKTVELGTPEAASSANSARKSKKPKKRLCWVVANEMLEKFQLPELPLQNQWDYTLTPKISEGADAPQHEQSPPAEVEATASPVVAAVANSAPTTPNTGQTPTAAQGAKKRATLIMSVPRDQPIHLATKNKLISQFLRRQSDASNPKEKKPEKPPPTVSDDVVMLSD
ncbi:chromatin assembly factor 1 subunit A [Drosophila subpulchrella]|uniref:chromatin assembly factor 1 subunit A n=1 Tax=Drosophila subpulchrella TaxID=1486046 RepID=UPI0018A145FD|nr:chromatin assembly factor 1 subunit A [Drosophila subpulchrella]